MGSAGLSLIVEAKWKNALQQVLGPWEDALVSEWVPGEDRPGIYFFDHDDPDCENKIQSLSRKGKAVFLIVSERATLPQVWIDGRVDDILVTPFRRMEVLSKIRGYQQILLWEEVTRINASFSEIIEGLHDDLRLAERLQKAQLPKRFPEIKGVTLASRYLAGSRAGGDYFEVVESKEQARLSVILSDSSSYGLSGMVLAAVMQVAFRLGRESSLGCADVVRAIAGDLGTTLTEKDQLSLFYGQWSRKDLVFRYLNLGGVYAYHAPFGDLYRALPRQGDFLRGNEPGRWSQLQEVELVLQPKDRMVVASDGFVQLCGGEKEFERLLDCYREKEPLDSLNEMAFQVKKNLPHPEDLPEQDCTALMIEIPANVLRLTPKRGGT